MRLDGTPTPTASPTATTGKLAPSDFLRQGSSGGGGAGIAAATSVPLQVWLGDPGNYADNPNPNPSDHATSRDTLTSLDAAKIDYINWSDRQLRSWINQCYRYGYITSPTDVGGALNTWQSMVTQAAIYQQGTTYANATPNDLLGFLSGGKTNLANLAKRANAGEGGVTHTKTVVYDKASVKSLAESVLQDRLGRDPTDAEVNSFFDAYRAKAAANPTTETTDAQGNVVTKSGYSDADLEDYIKTKAQNSPEYGKVQASTTYYNAIMQALGPVGGNLN